MSADSVKLLVIDDEPVVGRLLSARLEAAGYNVTVMNDSTAAVEAYAGLAPDAVISDFWMPGLDGVNVVTEVLRRDSAACVILLSGDINVPNTVRALRAGAEDVLTKPADLDLLRAAIDRGLARTRLIRTHRVTATQVSDPYGFLDESPSMRRVVRIVESVAGHTVPALIVGEPGTGKLVVAEMLHQLSPRAGRPFIRTTCADLNPALLRDALSAAAGGTIFLGELAELSKASQELLSGLFTGAHDSGAAISAVRIVAATERDLSEGVRRGAFRADLYQRLAVLPIAVPSLRDRGDDAIRTLSARFVHAQRFAVGRGPVRLSEDALTLLVTVSWPGNVRQLRQVIEEAFFLALDRGELERVHLRDVLERSGLRNVTESGRVGIQSLEEMERHHIAHVLTLTGGHRSEAAKILGITRTTLYKKMDAYGLDSVGRS